MRAAMARVDLHQHVFTEPLLEALGSRRRLPRVRHSDGQLTIYAAGEAPSRVELASECAEARAALLRGDRLDQAVVAISSPLGMESLPRHEAQPLIEAHLSGVEALPRAFAAWGPLPIDEPEPDDVDVLVARGCVGISLPAVALSGPQRIELLGPVLERTAALGVPLFVHPGSPDSQALQLAPPWWAALTDYVAQMHAAWLSFAAFGRRQHPELMVVFSMLAGCAPLHVERLTKRGGPPLQLRDPQVYYDTSSYGSLTINTMALVVGERQLVYGSDRPVITPCTTGLDTRLQRQAGELVGQARVALR